MKYAKQFGISVEETTSREQLALLVEEYLHGDVLEYSHFSKHSVDEHDVQMRFFRKVQSLCHEKPVSTLSNSREVLPKRKTRKPKKYLPFSEDDFVTPLKDTHVHSHTEETTQYCICEQELSDDMIQCDNPHCKHQWFHYSCVGITDPSTLPDKWYCPECRNNSE